MENNSQPTIFIQDPNQNQDEQKTIKKSSASQILNLGKIFLFMLIGIALTGVTCSVFAYLIDNVIPINDTTVLVLTIVSVICGVGTLFCSIAATFLVNSSKPHSFSVAIPFVIYSLCIGYLFGLIAFSVPWQIFAYTFGITFAIYGILGLVGLFVKSNLNPLIYVISTLFGGALILALTNLIIGIFNPYLMGPLSWVVSFVIFAALMFTTIFDVWRIKKIAQSGTMNNNLSLYCAFILYCDFVALFIRILYFVIIIFGRSRN